MKNIFAKPGKCTVTSVVEDMMIFKLYTSHGKLLMRVPVVITSTIEGVITCRLKDINNGVRIKFPATWGVCSSKPVVLQKLKTLAFLENNYNGEWLDITPLDGPVVITHGETVLLFDLGPEAMGVVYKCEATPNTQKEQPWRYLKNKRKKT